MSNKPNSRGIIQDGRLVSDKTFATRFVSFLKDVQVNDVMSEQELQYFRRIAELLLRHQVSTCTDGDELSYLKRCHPELAYD
jgi:hypothetical protein